MNAIKHIACVMDGNRRWAKENGMDSLLGHEHGLGAMKRTLQFCIKNGIKYASFYAFSTENFRRTDKEKNFLFGHVARLASKEFNKLIKENIRIRFFGLKEKFPKSLQKMIKEVEENSVSCTGLTVNFLLGYGSRLEIVRAAKKVAQDIADNKVDPDNISEESFKKYLWTNGTPDPEIIVRPGRHARLSNFLLYQGAYSELYFPNCLWPEVDEDLLQGILDDYNQCQLNFGK
ncbi:di-trans,poly-cis-decaprenylcistransferase [bacterium]|jgi:undecaprenyl diphosphate synthase|nr:di-trans,poly-cis-decaprenylcistransferase [bacterium]